MHTSLFRWGILFALFPFLSARGTHQLHNSLSSFKPLLLSLWSFSKAKLLRWNCTQFCRLKWHWCCGFVYVELFKDLKGKEDDECTSQVQSLGLIQRKYPGVQHISDLYTVKRSIKECKFTSCALKWCRWKQQEVIFISKLCWCASLIGS